MPRFRVEVLETRRHLIEVVANTQDEAEQLAYEMEDLEGTDAFERREIDGSTEIEDPR